MPTVSVIVPIYNVEKYLHRCLDSILAQTFTDFELILVDDGSPDRCGEICDEYAKKDSRIHVIHKENGGLSDARNKGIDWAFANSDSEWLTFIDSDDWVYKKYLEYLYRGVKKTSCGISLCSYEETTGEELSVEEFSISVETVDTETFFCKQNVNAIIACGKLYKKELFEKIRYPFGKLHEDEFTTYKLLFQCDKLAWINAPMYAYYKNELGITKSEWSPKRIDKVEALMERIVFFDDNEFYSAYNYNLKYLAYTITENYIELMKNPCVENFDYYNNYLIKCMRTVLYFSKKAKVKEVTNDKYHYIIAFPILSKLYSLKQLIKKHKKKKVLF